MLWRGKQVAGRQTERYEAALRDAVAEGPHRVTDRAMIRRLLGARRVEPSCGRAGSIAPRNAQRVVVARVRQRQRNDPAGDQQEDGERTPHSPTIATVPGHRFFERSWGGLTRSSVLIVITRGDCECSAHPAHLRRIQRSDE